MPQPHAIRQFTDRDRISPLQRGSIMLVYYDLCQIVSCYNVTTITKYVQRHHTNIMDVVLLSCVMASAHVMLCLKMLESRKSPRLSLPGSTVTKNNYETEKVIKSAFTSHYYKKVRSFMYR